MASSSAFSSVVATALMMMMMMMATLLPGAYADCSIHDTLGKASACNEDKRGCTWDSANERCFKSPPSSDTNIGLIIGLSVGVVVVLGAIVFAWWWFHKNDYKSVPRADKKMTQPAMKV